MRDREGAVGSHDQALPEGCRRRELAVYYRFGDSTLDTQRYELRRAGHLVPLRPKVFHVLAYLLTHREEVVSKDTLMAQVWPGQCISDEMLSVGSLSPHYG